MVYSLIDNVGSISKIISVKNLRRAVFPKIAGEFYIVSSCIVSERLKSKSRLSYSFGSN